MRPDFLERDPNNPRAFRRRLIEDSLVINNYVQQQNKCPRDIADIPSNKSGLSEKSLLDVRITAYTLSMVLVKCFGKDRVVCWS